MRAIKPRNLLIERLSIRILADVDRASIDVVDRVGEVAPAVSAGIWMRQRLVFLLLVHEVVQILVGLLNSSHFMHEFWARLAGWDFDLLDLSDVLFVLEVNVSLRREVSAGLLQLELGVILDVSGHAAVLDRDDQAAILLEVVRWRNRINVKLTLKEILLQFQGVHWTALGQVVGAAILMKTHTAVAPVELISRLTLIPVCLLEGLSIKLSSK